MSRAAPRDAPAFRSREQYRSVVEPQRAPRGRAVSGREQLGIDSLRHDLDALGVGSVVSHQLVALIRCGGDHQIGAPHDFRLDARPKRDLVVESDLRPHAIE